LRPGFRLSAGRTSRSSGKRSSRRQGGVGPGGPGSGSTAVPALRSPAAPGAASDARPSSDQETLERRPERGGVHVSGDLPLADEGDHAVLLGDDDRDGVGLLG